MKISKRNFRPKYHFTTEKGWINDPNGLSFYEGKYHLFYQHYPDDTKWGPMHWGHAISKDLWQWEHLPIALYPDKNGMAFSGSAVADEENISNLGSADKNALIAMYTSHGDKETQSVAYSLDGVNFTNLDKNPVIENPNIPDFRDPKIFKNPDTNSWHMVLAAGDRVMFYSTQNFIDFEKTGEFGPEGNFASGVWECPDMIPLECDGNRIWMLIVSMGTTDEEGRSNTQYFLGEFDGEKFTATYPFDKMEKIDEGCDNYAAVSFNNIDKKIMIGWAINWGYADGSPTGEYCGSMTLPREVELIKTPKGIRLASSVFGVDKLLQGEINISSGDSIDTEQFCLKIKGTGKSEFKLLNSKNQSLDFGVDEQNNLYLDRTNAGDSSFNEYFTSDICSFRKCERFFDSSYEIELYFDTSVAELFIDSGTRVISMVVYPDEAYSKIDFSGDVEVSLYKM